MSGSGGLQNRLSRLNRAPGMSSAYQPPPQGRVTPIHVFTVRLPDGATRLRAIPGGICASLPDARVLSRYPEGAKVVSRTWRSDYRYIHHRSNSQPDYQR